MADTYFMFVDAFGDPGRFKRKNTRFYVLSGLILILKNLKNEILFIMR